MFTRMLLSGVAIGVAGLAQSASFLYTAALNGWQEVPPSGSPGIANIVFALNDATLTLSGSGDLHFLSTPNVTGFHIHSGAYGQNGLIVQDIGPAAIFGNSIGFTITLTSSQFNSLKSLMDSGNSYANIHTSNFPGGEIRGQISAVPEPATLIALGVGIASVCRARRRAR